MKKFFFVFLAIFLLQPAFISAQGCIEPTSDEGVSVVGYIQPEFGYTFLGEDLDGNSLNENSFYFNRARIGVVGNIPYDFNFYVMTEFSPKLGGPFILDAYLSYTRLGPWAKVSIGQFKSPFGLELSTACHKLHTINRSEVVNNLSGPFRDMGLMISGGTDTLSILGSKTKNFIGYQFAVMNGTGKNVLDDNFKKDIVGRVTIHPVEFLTVGASYRFGKHPTIIQDAPDDQRSRYGFDLEVKYKGFTVQGEYINGSDVGSYTTGGGCDGDLELHEGSIDRDGYMVQGMYMTPWKIQPVLKFEAYDPDLASELDNDRIHTMTYGINYFFNDWARLQINYLYNAEKGNEVENDAILVQAQVVF